MRVSPGQGGGAHLANRPQMFVRILGHRWNPSRDAACPYSLSYRQDSDIGINPVSISIDMCNDEEGDYVVLTEVEGMT